MPSCRSPRHENTRSKQGRCTTRAFECISCQALQETIVECSQLQLLREEDGLEPQELHAEDESALARQVEFAVRGDGHDMQRSLIASRRRLAHLDMLILLSYVMLSYTMLTTTMYDYVKVSIVKYY